ncbi:MAG: hypothetical protein ACXAEN_23780, partial [Candidatus Thorarchaeota archaeon]
MTFDIYSLAYKWVKEGAQRGFGGDVIGVDDPVDRGQVLMSQIQKYDNDRVLQLVVYTILSYSLDFIGKKVIPGRPFPLGLLRKQFTKWAKDLIKKSMEFQPPEPTLNDQDEDNFSSAEGPWKDLFASQPPETEKDLPPTEAIGYADKILEFIHQRAAHDNTPGANPSSFYMRPMYDYARDTHTATKVAIQLSTAGAVELKAEPFQLFTKEDLFKYRGYVGGPITEYNNLLMEDNSASHRVRESDVFTVLRDWGYDSFIRAIDSSIGVLRYWYQSPETICCVIRVLGGIGKIDKSFLYALRTVLIYMINKEKDNLSYVFDKISQLLNSIVMALMSKIAGVLESIAQRAIKSLSVTIKVLSEDDVARDCSPLDELLANLQGGILSMQIDLTATINSIIGDLTLRDAKLVQVTGNVEKKQRLERFLKIVNVIINALETGELCSDDVDEIGKDDPPIPTIEEIERFLTVGLLPEFEDS